MEERYKILKNLSERQYTLGCPVILMAGRLLWDYEKERTVAQLKWKSISQREINGLYVRIAGRTAEYTGTGIRRGESFGQYKAIPIDKGEKEEIRVFVEKVSFSDGGEWKCPKEALWGVLPQFHPAGGGRFAEEKHADLWYCTCGGLNREDEAVCHVCGRRFGEPRILAGSDPAEKMPLKDLPVRKEADDWKRPVKPELPKPTFSFPSGTELRKKAERWIVPGGIAGGVLFAALIISFVLGKGKGDESLTEMAASEVQQTTSVYEVTEAMAEETEAVAEEDNEEKASSAEDDIEVNAPGAGLDYTAIYLHEDEEGEIHIDQELINEYFPDCTASCFFGTMYVGDEIDSYIRDSFCFAGLIADGLHAGIRSDRNSTDPERERESNFCLLAFDDSSDSVRLTGYFVGRLEKYAEGTWLVKLRHCDYDISHLYEQELDSFQNGKELLYTNYIPYDEAMDCGASYMIQGYNTGRSMDPREDDCQMYHLWYELNSPHVDRYARDIERLKRTHVSQGRYVCVLLLDEARNYMGYTMLSNE